MANLISLCLVILLMDLLPSTLGSFNYYPKFPPKHLPRNINPYPYIPKPIVHRPPRGPRPIPTVLPSLPPLVGPKSPHGHVMPPLPPIGLPPIPSFVGPNHHPKYQVPFPPPPATTTTTIAPVPSSSPHTCPIDMKKLRPCVNLLDGISRISIGNYTKGTCCPLLQGIADLDAALCLCTNVKAKSLNVNLVTPAALGLLAGCGKYPPPGFKCPA